MKLFLIGYPLTHSFSPRIHNAALQAAALHDWHYSLLPIPPKDLPAAVERLRAPDCAGANITIPHKQAIIPLLDSLTPAAQLIGAVNTIFKSGQKLVGDNTDALGFLAALKRWRVDEPSNALILGAGGSARAVTYALLQNGWQVTIAARRLEQAQALAKDGRQWSRDDDHPGAQGIPLSRLAHAVRHLPPGTLIVNCTPAGMFPRVEASPWPEGVPFPAGATVYDLVYNPRETRLVRQARAEGLPAVTGLGMLVEQAALAFEHWTGRTAPRDVMASAAEERQNQ
ncbi:MAG: shikimate dehydrogenase [Chloroflexi bacterium]|nr:shikimate dehydrogenase [Chloroflexota bacterium]